MFRPARNPKETARLIRRVFVISSGFALRGAVHYTDLIMNRGISRFIIPRYSAHAQCFRLGAFLLFSALPARLSALGAGAEYSLESSISGFSGGGLVAGGGYSAKGAAGQILPDNHGLLSGGEYVGRAGFYNPPHFTYQKGLASTLIFPGGKASLTLPADSVDKEAFDITLNKDPLAAPVNIMASEIESANYKINANEGSWSLPLPGNLTELCLFDEQNYWAGAFNKAGFLSLSYRDEDGDGVLDGSIPPVRTDTVRAWALDTDADMWAKLPPSEVAAGERSITVKLMAPGVYALLGTMDESVKNTYVFPVPFRPNGPKAGAGQGQTGTAAEGITFANIPQAGKIEIYTLDGRLVRRLNIPSNMVIPKLKWDVKNSAGEKAASGVYIWRVISGANSKTGKLMVIW